MMMHDHKRSAEMGSLLKVGLSLAVLAVALAAPPPAGLSAQGQRVLAVVLAALVLWASEAVPLAVSSLLTVVLLVMVQGVGNLEAALRGFAQPVGYFVLGVLALGAAVLQSGLAERLARMAVIRARGSSLRMYLQLLAAMLSLTLFLPSAITRTAVLMPPYLGVFRQLGLRRGDGTPRVITLALAALNPLASSAMLTGGVAPIVTAQLLGGFSWLRWFALMSVPYYALIGMGALGAYLLVRPGRLLTSQLSPGPDGQRPLSLAECKVAITLTGVSLLWLADFLHHWHPAIPALLGAVFLVAPRVGVMSWADFEKNSPWPLFLLLGATLSLAEALRSSGASDWIAGFLVAALSLGPDHPLFRVVGLIVLVAAANPVLPHRAAALSVLIPIVTSYAAGAGFTPEVLGLITLMVIDAALFYPAQSPTSLIAYQGRYYRPTDLTWLGLGLVVALMLVTLLVALPYWAWLGLPLQPGPR